MKKLKHILAIVASLTAGLFGGLGVYNIGASLMNQSNHITPSDHVGLYFWSIFMAIICFVLVFTTIKGTAR